MADAAEDEAAEDFPSEYATALSGVGTDELLAESVEEAIADSLVVFCDVVDSSTKAETDDSFES
ncbi:MAG: hypothetical protein ACKO7B_21395, partial [Flavobacteriales bacterium]